MTDDKSIDFLDEGDYFEKRCGEIFLTMKGFMIFNCTLCAKLYRGFEEFAFHVATDHKRSYLETTSEDYLDTNIEDTDTTLNYDKLEIKKEDIVIEPVVEDYCSKALEEKEISIDSLKKNPKPKSKLSKKFKSRKGATIGIANIQSNKKQNQIEIRPLQKRTNYFASTDEVRPLKCDLCDATFKHPSSLSKHKARHRTEKIHPCPDCNKLFYTVFDVRKHQRSHLDERPFLCSECGRTFIDNVKLKDHMRRHTNQRDYECSECQKKFYNAGLLRNHKLVHKSEKQFACTICEAKFTFKKGLRNHLKLHENKREYKCELCDAEFNQQAGLFCHKKTKHQIS